jgi:hypothetical protein
MTSITSAIAKIKDDPKHLLDQQTLLQSCRDLGYTWRNRIFDPVTIVSLFIVQVMNGNVACQGLTHLSSLTFTATAYCRARKRLPLKVYQWLCRSFIEGLRSSTKDVAAAGDWFGHRVFRVDGTGISMPDTTELQEHFGQPTGMKPGCGFPVAHLLVMIDAATGFIVDVVGSCWNRHDASLLIKLHCHLQPGDVVLGDRGFCSYAHLALFSLAKTHAVMRLHQRTIANFKPHRPRSQDLPKGKKKGQPRSLYIERLGHDDQLVEYVKPTRCPDWMSPEQYVNLPATLILRELRYHIRRKGYRTRSVTLVTTLLDPVKYPKADLARLYDVRWQIETDLLALKQTLGLDVLRCHTVEGVMKELLIFVIVYNLVRLVMLRSAQQQGVKPDRISFIDTLRWLRSKRWDDPIPDLLINPHRPGRHQPRVIKRKKDRYSYMTKPRRELLANLYATAVKA